MALGTVYGVNAAAMAAVPSQKALPGENSGGALIMYDEYVFPAEYAANDIIVMGSPLPAGARVLAAVVACPDVGGTATLALGTAGTAGALMAAVDNSGQAVRASIDAGAADAFKKLTVATQYQFKASGASASATGKKISLMIEYVVI